MEIRDVCVKMREIKQTGLVESAERKAWRKLCHIV